MKSSARGLPIAGLAALNPKEHAGAWAAAPMVATMALVMIGPMPGTGISRSNGPILHWQPSCQTSSKAVASVRRRARSEPEKGAFKRMKVKFVPYPLPFSAHEFDSQSALVPIAETGHAAYAAIALGPFSKFQELDA